MNENNTACIINTPSNSVARPSSTPVESTTPYSILAPNINEPLLSSVTPSGITSTLSTAEASCSDVVLLKLTSRVGRRPTFTHPDYLIIVREVAACKAHVARFREIGKKFDVASKRANENPNLSTKVTAKRLQDRFKRFMESFERKDVGERRISGIGGEVGEIEEILGRMVEERNDVVRSRDEEKEARSAKELRKEVVGLALVEQATKRKATSESDGYAEGRGAVILDEDDITNDLEVSPRFSRSGKAKRLKVGDGNNGLAELVEALKKADLAHAEVEKQHLDLERQRMDMEREERVADREMRREDRNSHERLGLENFKLMMATLLNTMDKSRCLQRISL